MKYYAIKSSGGLYVRNIYATGGHSLNPLSLNVVNKDLVAVQNLAEAINASTQDKQNYVKVVEVELSELGEVDHEKNLLA